MTAQPRDDEKSPASRVVEERLRAALIARAELVTADDLGPEQPPIGDGRVRKMFRDRRGRVVAAALLVTVAAVLAVGFLLFPDTTSKQPTEPAHVPVPGVSNEKTPTPGPGASDVPPGVSGPSQAPTRR